jgi:protein required for attachment to host cells
VVEPPPPHRPAGEPSRLREVQALTDSEGALKGNDVFSNSRSGTNRSPGGGQFEYDDHRASHRHEVERRFSKRIAEALRAIVQSRATEVLVLAAEPHMLGLLRAQLDGAALGGTELRELSENLSAQTAEQIQFVLSRHGVLPTAVR